MDDRVEVGIDLYSYGDIGDVPCPSCGFPLWVRFGLVVAKCAIQCTSCGTQIWLRDAMPERIEISIRTEPGPGLVVVTTNGRNPQAMSTPVFAAVVKAAKEGLLDDLSEPRMLAVTP